MGFIQDEIEIRDVVFVFYIKTVEAQFSFNLITSYLGTMKAAFLVL